MLKWKKVRNHIETSVPLGSDQEAKFSITFLERGRKIVSAWAYHWLLYSETSEISEEKAREFCETVLMPKVIEYAQKEDTKNLNMPNFGSKFKL